MLAASLVILVSSVPIISVTPPGFERAAEPQVAVENSNVYIAFGQGNALFLSRSNDGTSYQPPVKIWDQGELSLGMRRGPRLTVQKRIVTVTAVYGDRGKGRDGDVLSWKSLDGGITWSNPAKVNDVEGSAREGLHGMAVAPDGTIACAWLDLRGKGTQLYLSTSKDAGATWSKNRLVYASPDGTICECCHPSLVFDNKGALHVMFRNWLMGARDMYVVSSMDQGQSFGSARKLGKGSWKLNACPMDGGALGMDGSGSVTAVWRREDTVFTGYDRVLGTGRQPWMAPGKDLPFVVWESDKGITSLSHGLMSPNGTSPVVASTGSGKWAIASWAHNGIKAAKLKPIGD